MLQRVTLLDSAWSVSITGKYVFVLALTTMRTSLRNVATYVRNLALFLLLALLSVAGASSLVNANNTYFKHRHKQRLRSHNVSCAPFANN